MPTTDDTELYAERWNEHIDDLRKIGMSLPPEKISELNENIEDLERLVDDAVAYMEEDTNDEN